MIEINLLPPQYRTVERTPLPVFIGLILAVCLTGGAMVFLSIKGREGDELRAKLEVVNAKLKQASAKAAEWDDYNKRITEARVRVDTVLQIAQSRLRWSMKVEQLVSLMPETMWIENLNCGVSARGGQMTFRSKLGGSNFAMLAQFKKSLRESTNFFYHFDSVEIPSAQIVKLAGGYAVPDAMAFQVTLPLRTSEVGAAAPAKN